MVGDVITVEVAYAKSDEQRIFELQVPPGTTARDAVEQSGVGEHFPEIDLENLKLGIFGKVAKPDVALQAGDRVEIYRPLIADPKEQRKKKAAEGKVMRRGAREANAQQDEESAE
jgi:hypothetical protein